MENFYNITLYTNAFFLAAVCLCLPRKWKLDSNGSTKAGHIEVFGGVVCSVSIIWTFFATLILFCDWANRLISIKEHWIMYFFFIVGANTYIIYRLVESHRKSIRRKSILFMLRKHQSPEMTLEKMNEFCKEFDLQYFPIQVFRHYLSHFEEKKEEGDLIGKTFERLKTNLSHCKEYELLKKSVHSFQNYQTISKEGGFS